MSCRGGSRDGESICPLGVAVPNRNPLKVRGGPWAPPPRNVIPQMTLFCFVVGYSVLGSDYNSASGHNRGKLLSVLSALHVLAYVCFYFFLGAR